jgi:hypothetical protein
MDLHGPFGQGQRARAGLPDAWRGGFFSMARAAENAGTC